MNKILKKAANSKKDRKEAFPHTKGFSRTNNSYMVQFAKEYPEPEIIQQLVGQIPWGHNLILIQRLHNMEERLWKRSKQKLTKEPMRKHKTPYLVQTFKNWGVKLCNNLLHKPLKDLISLQFKDFTITNNIFVYKTLGVL